MYLKEIIDKSDSLYLNWVSNQEIQLGSDGSTSYYAYRFVPATVTTSWPTITVPTSIKIVKQGGIVEYVGDASGANGQIIPTGTTVPFMADPTEYFLFAGWTTDSTESNLELATMYYNNSGNTGGGNNFGTKTDSFVIYTK